MKKYSKFLFPKFKKFLLNGLIVCSSFVLASCGSEAYNVVPAEKTLLGPGSFVIPPRVDMVMVVDDTGSMYEAYPALQNQIPKFLTKLDSMQWDYHFTIIPLTQYRKVKQVVGSIYDINRGSSWKPRYPGDNGQDSMLSSSIFKTPETFTSYITRSEMSNSNNGLEPGLDNIYSIFTTGFEGSGFFRNDAATVLIIVGNGDDTSHVNFCRRPIDNQNVPCEEVDKTLVCSTTASDPFTGGSTSCRSQDTSFSQYIKLFKDLRPNLKVYSIVGKSESLNCLGAPSHIGERYINLANIIGGKSFDICSKGSSADGVIAAALSDMTSYLQTQRADYIVDYVMIDEKQVPTKVVVQRNGDPSKTVEIPHDDKNGWSYVGRVSGVYAFHIMAPNGDKVNLSLVSGNAIRFNGSTQVKGVDKILITEVPEGAQNSVTSN